MTDTLTRRRQAIHVQLTLRAAFFPTLAAMIAIGLHAQNPSSAKSAAPMQTFVIIFRQGPPAPTPEERQRTSANVRAWAQRVNTDGHKLDPRILAPENEVRSEQGAARLPSGEWPVTALLFLEAHDLEEATKIAESHPALHNRAIVEVRPWSPPVRPAVQPSDN